MMKWNTVTPVGLRTANEQFTDGSNITALRMLVWHTAASRQLWRF